MKIKNSVLSSRLYPCIIFILAFLQYTNTISADYAWDDKLVITGNDYTRQGVHGLYDIFANRVSVPYKNVYRPVPQAMFAIEYDLFNHDPHYSHFFNVFWYAILCVMIFFFTRMLFSSWPPLFAFATALLYLVHPLHVEVVANIKSRDEILALLFGLCSIMLLSKTTQKKWWMLFAALCCFTLAILSKENVVTLLPVAGISLWYYKKNLGNRWWMLIFMLLALSAGLFYWISQNISASAQKGAMHLDATVLNNVFLWTTNPAKIIPTAIGNIYRYLLLFIYPHPLIHLYGYNQVPLEGWGSFKAWGTTALLLFSCWYVFKNFKRKSPAVFGILYFFITFSVYSNFFVLAPDTMADRYLFIPSLGLVLIVTDVLFYFIQPLGGKMFVGSVRPKIAIAIFAIFVTGYFTRTAIANLDWENDYTLIYNRIQYMENNAAAQATYGLMLYKEGDEAVTEVARKNKRIEAMKAFTRSVEIYPDFYWSWISIGKIFTEERMFSKAELAFLKAQQLEPVTADGYFCLGSLYYTMGAGELSTTYLEKAVLLQPEAMQYYEMLGLAYLQTDNMPNMAALAKTGIDRFGANATFYALMAVYHHRNGNDKQAKIFNHLALQTDPKNRTALLLNSVLLSLPGANAQGDSTKTFSTPAP